MATVVANLRPAVLDLLLYAGDGNTATVRFKDANGNLIDASAYTWVATWRPERDSDDTLAIDIPIDQTGASGGLVLVQFTAAVTNAMLASSVTGYWDLQGTQGSDDPQTAVTGKVTLQQDVTR